MKFYKILLLNAISILLFSCAAQTGNVVKSRDFTLTKDTRIAVQTDTAPGFGMGLEAHLLGLGYDVVPYEVAITAISTDMQSSVYSDNSSLKVNTSSQTYAARYIPAGVSISLRVNLHRYPAATYFLGGYVRIIDLSDQRLLASFQYKGNEFTFYNEDALLQKFVNDLNNLLSG